MFRHTLDYFKLSECSGGDGTMIIMGQSDTVSWGDDGRTFVTLGNILDHILDYQKGATDPETPGWENLLLHPDRSRYSDDGDTFVSATNDMDRDTLFELA